MVELKLKIPSWASQQDEYITSTLDYFSFATKEIHAWCAKHNIPITDYIVVREFRPDCFEHVLAIQFKRKEDALLAKLAFDGDLKEIVR